MTIVLTPAARSSGAELDADRVVLADATVTSVTTLAAAEVEGVHAVAAVTLARRADAVAVAIELVAAYGRGIPRLAEEVRRNLAVRLQALTGLRVASVDVLIGDIHLDDGVLDEVAASDPIELPV